MRRRFSLERLTTNNEIAGFKFATVGVLYAVLIAFAVIIVWERFSERGERSVVQEAGAAATLYLAGRGRRPGRRATARGAISGYPAAWLRSPEGLAADGGMAEGQPRGHAVPLDGLYDAHALRAGAARANARPAGGAGGDLPPALDLVTQARRTRLHLATRHRAGHAVGDVLMLGGVLTVAFTFFFGTRNLGAQMLMTGILALIVFMGLFVIVAQPSPTGAVYIDSERTCRGSSMISPGAEGTTHSYARTHEPTERLAAASGVGHRLLAHHGEHVVELATASSSWLVISVSQRTSP